MLILQMATHGIGHGAMSSLARDLDIDVKRLEHVISGRGGLSAGLARIIVERYDGLTIDWLYYGRRGSYCQTHLLQCDLLNR
jgi:hypothetical protein